MVDKPTVGGFVIWLLLGLVTGWDLHRMVGLFSSGRRLPGRRSFPRHNGPETDGSLARPPSAAAFGQLCAVATSRPLAWRRGWPGHPTRRPRLGWWSRRRRAAATTFAAAAWWAAALRASSALAARPRSVSRALVAFVLRLAASAISLGMGAALLSGSSIDCSAGHHRAGGGGWSSGAVSAAGARRPRRVARRGRP